MDVKKILLIGTVTCTIVGTAWAMGDHFGFRPAIKAEVVEVMKKIEIVGNSVDWLELENLERKLIRSGLSRRECARYRTLARRLNTPAKPC